MFRLISVVLSVLFVMGCGSARGTPDGEPVTTVPAELEGISFELVQIDDAPLPQPIAGVRCPDDRGIEAEMLAGTLTFEGEGRYSMHSTLRMRCLDEAGEPATEWRMESGIDRGRWRIVDARIMMKPSGGREGTARLVGDVLRLEGVDTTLVFRRQR